MKAIKNMTAGTVTRSNAALAIFAVTLRAGGTATGAPAKSRHHHFHHVSEASESPRSGSWRDANASIGGGGHSFSGVASTYGNESGSQTASGQRVNENAMTC